MLSTMGLEAVGAQANSTDKGLDWDGPPLIAMRSARQALFLLPHHPAPFQGGCWIFWDQSPTFAAFAAS